MHRSQWHATLKAYAYPVLGDLPVAAIDTDLCTRVLEPIWSTRQVTARRVRGRIERVLDWAKARGLRSGENPALWRGHLANLLAKPSTTKKHHPALPFDEVPALIAELRQREGITERALEFVILTAARVGEALGARWSEFDLANWVWTIPASRMKAGKEHRTPLCGRVVEILNLLPHERDNDFVFVGTRKGTGLRRPALLKLLRDMLPDTAVTIHGFRSTFRDWAGERTNFAREIAEAALAHVVGDETERAYRRGDALEKRRELMNAWAAFCANPAQTGTVISFPGNTL